MGSIRELPREVSEKIAAGEVVERPASVVRELVENSIDAGASSIAIDLAEGGRRHIAVMDDGSGMDAGDLSRSVLRHATSKIAVADDLFRVGTMGFRGEALAAIGAVSRMTIETRENRPGAVEGARIEVAGGAVAGPFACGCAAGTRVVAADLFFNVPARLKFLKSPSVEFGHAFEAVASLALSYPEIRFELKSDGKTRFVSRAGDIDGRVQELLGRSLEGELAMVEEAGEGIALRGWIGEGGRAAAKDLRLFVNRRPVRDKVLMHAVSAAFGERLRRGEYPAAVLWLEIDPAEVDVNVHPAKREVRFARSGAVHDFVMAACRKAFASTNGPTANTASSLRLARSGAARSTAPRPPLMEATESDGLRRRSEAVLARGPRELDGVSRSEEAVFAFGPNVHEGVLRVIGQLGATYIVCEDEGGTLVLIDQHAAHEKLGFDQLKANHSQGFIPQQVLLVPERVELGPKERAYVMDNLELLSKAGFEVEPFGGSTLLVKAVPEILGDSSVACIFAELAAELEEIGSSEKVDETIERIFAVVACHRQVRSGDRLSAAELSALVRDIEREGVTHCPHGRPALVRVEKGEIERWFKRRN